MFQPFLNKTIGASGSVAIAVKQQIRHKILDTFTSELMAIDTPCGLILIGTTYPTQTLHRSTRHFSAPATKKNNIHDRKLPCTPQIFFGYTETNAIGGGFASFISDGRFTHLGPYIATFKCNNSTKLCIVFTTT